MIWYTMWAKDLNFFNFSKLAHFPNDICIIIYLFSQWLLVISALPENEPKVYLD